MIWDSHVWKKALTKELNSFTQFILKRKFDNDNLLNLKIERFFFVTAYIIRKLNESKKISDDVNSIMFEVTEFKRKGDSDNPHFLNCYKINDFYYLHKKKKSTLNLWKLTNYLIHSFCFIPYVNPCLKFPFSGLYFNSDRIKNRKLYYLKFCNYRKIIDQVIKDRIVHSYYNRETGVLILRNKLLRRSE